MSLFGEQIKLLRKKYKLRQTDLAAAIGLSQSHYSKLEKKECEPAADIIIAASTLFNVSTDWLLIGVNKETLQNNLPQEYDVLIKEDIPTEDTFKDFPKRLKQIIESRAYDQKQVATMLGISEHSFTKYLNGRIPQTEILYKISLFYGTTMEWLLAGTNNMTITTEENTSILLLNTSIASIGDRIRYARNKNNLSMAKLAESINATSSNISDWENGKSNPSTINLLNLSIFFGVSADWILTGREFCSYSEYINHASPAVDGLSNFDISIDSINSQAFGKRLKKVIEFMNITQKYLADRIGISKTSMTNYVNGRIPDVNILYALAKYLGVSIEWLLTGEEVDKSNQLSIMQKLSEEDKRDLTVFLSFLKERRNHNNYKSNYSFEDNEILNNKVIEHSDNNNSLEEYKLELIEKLEKKRDESLGRK